MALLDAPQAKGAMSGGPTLFGIPMKQASLITVSLFMPRNYVIIADIFWDS